MRDIVFKMKRRCTNCEGTGFYVISLSGHGWDGRHGFVCHYCSGTGEVDLEELETEELEVEEWEWEDSSNNKGE